MKVFRNIAVCVLALAACFLIWPYGVITTQKTWQTGNEYNHLTEPLSGGVYAVQGFVASEKMLEEIVVMVDKSNMTSEEGRLQLQLMDETGTVLQTVEAPIAEIPSNSSYKMKIHTQLTKGGTYQFSLQAVDTQGDGPRMVYRSQERAGIPELGTLSYFGVAPLPDAVGVVKLVYRIGLTWYQILIYDGFILFVAAMLLHVKSNPLYS